MGPGRSAPRMPERQGEVIMTECPFCGAVNSAIVQPVQIDRRVSPGGLPVAGHAMHCAIHKGGCGASGPIAMAPEQARPAWEARAWESDLSFYRVTRWNWRRPWKLPGAELVKARGRVRPL